MLIAAFPTAAAKAEIETSRHARPIWTLYTLQGPQSIENSRNQLKTDHFSHGLVSFFFFFEEVFNLVEDPVV